MNCLLYISYSPTPFFYCTWDNQLNPACQVRTQFSQRCSACLATTRSRFVETLLNLFLGRSLTCMRVCPSLSEREFNSQPQDLQILVCGNIIDLVWQVDMFAQWFRYPPFIVSCLFKLLRCLKSHLTFDLNLRSAAPSVTCCGIFSAL